MADFIWQTFTEMYLTRTMKWHLNYGEMCFIGLTVGVNLNKTLFNKTKIFFLKTNTFQVLVQILVHILVQILAIRHLVCSFQIS